MDANSQIKVVANLIRVHLENVTFYRRMNSSFFSGIQLTLSLLPLIFLRAVQSLKKFPTYDKTTEVHRGGPKKIVTRDFTSLNYFLEHSVVVPR